MCRNNHIFNYSLGEYLDCPLILVHMSNNFRWDLDLLCYGVIRSVCNALGLLLKISDNIRYAVYDGLL